IILLEVQEIVEKLASPLLVEIKNETSLIREADITIRGKEDLETIFQKTIKELVENNSYYSDYSQAATDLIYEIHKAVTENTPADDLVEMIHEKRINMEKK
ncbi:MAG: hypothetical protein ACLFQV_06470, partial [Vulcanimicrobiota bacterium]